MFEFATVRNMASAVSAMRSEQRHAEAAAAISTLVGAVEPNDAMKTEKIEQSSTSGHSEPNVGEMRPVSVSSPRGDGEVVSKSCALQ